MMGHRIGAQKNPEKAADDNPEDHIHGGFKEKFPCLPEYT